MGFATDVFVIGGGPAGLAAAIATRKKGLRVMVADGARPPIDKACGEGLLPDALASIRSLGVGLEESDGYILRGLRFLDSKASVEAEFPHGCGLGVRRKVLHQRMMERAQDCGVSLLWGAPVTGLFSGGVLLGGAEVIARWIVGADGCHSRVRRWSRLEAHKQLDRRFAYRRHYRLSPWTEYTEVYWGEEIQAYVTPVNEEEVCVAVTSRLSNDRLEDVLREFPELARRVQSAAPTGTERGAVTAMHRLKRVYRGNVALIGDASGSVDAITGEGLCLSFRQAVALAEALEAEDLRGYQEAHRYLFKRPTLMANMMLMLDRRSRLREHAIRALAANPQVFARMLAVHVGAASTQKLVVTSALLGWQPLSAMGLFLGSRRSSSHL
jgi:flavin-dependent dehydrogenase